MPDPKKNKKKDTKESLYAKMARLYPKYSQMRESTYKHGIGERFDDLTRLRDYQGKLTGEFAKAYPNVPVGDILNKAQGLEDPMTILNTSDRGMDAINQYGDLAIQPDQISKSLGADSTDYWNLLNRYAPTGTVGKDQDVVTKQKFGIRSMIMPRLRSDQSGKGEISIGMGPYQYLEEKRSGGTLTQTTMNKNKPKIKYYLPQKDMGGMLQMFESSGMIGPGMSGVESIRERIEARQARNNPVEGGPLTSGMSGTITGQIQLNPAEASAGLSDVQQLPEEGLGGILAQTAIGAGTGALAGAGVLSPIGAIIGGGIGLIKGIFGHRQEKLAKNAEEARAADQAKLLEDQKAQGADFNEQERRDTMVQNKLNAMPQAPVYAPVVANGGLLSYNGPSHADSAQRGIPVDHTGNPIRVTKQNPVALVEGGEIARHTGEGVFIYSKKSGHAKQVAKVQKNFQKALGKDLNGADKMAKEALNLRLDSIAEEQESVKKYKRGGRMMEEGGDLPEYGDGTFMYPWEQEQYQDRRFSFPWQQNQGQDQGPITSSGAYGGSSVGIQASPLTLPYSVQGSPFIAGGSRLGLPEGGQASTQAQPIPYGKPMSPIQGQPGAVTSAYGNYNAGQGPLGTQDTSNTFMDPNKSMGGEGFNLASLLSPAGHILSGLAATRDYNRLKKNPVEEVDMGPDVVPARAAAEQVSFAPERAMAREQATTGSAVAARTARNLGLSGGQAAANIGASRLGIQRAAGQQIGQSIQNEATTNAQLRQQTNMANMQATQQARLSNAQMRGQEGAYNAMLRNQYREQLRNADPLSNWLKIGASYLGDNVSYGNDQQTRQLYAPNAQFAQPTPLQWILGQKGKTSFKGNKVD